MPGQFEVMIERNFSSAHQLRGYKGKCENLHGHNYRIEIYARGRELDNIGLLVDFVELKAAADEVVQYLDHRNINELEPSSLSKQCRGPNAVDQPEHLWVLIGQLRKKIESDGESPRYVVSEPWVGYRFVTDPPVQAS